MKKLLFLFVMLLPMTGLILSCGSTPTSSNSNPTATPVYTSTSTPTPSAKTFISSFPAFSSGVSVYGMCVDSSDNLYVANYNGGSTSSNLMKVTSAGAATSMTQMIGLTDVAYVGSNWYGVSHAYSPYFYYYNGTTVTNPITSSTGLDGVAVNSAATTMALVSGNAVTLFSLPSFSVLGNTTLPASATNPQALAFDNNGNLYVALTNIIIKYAPTVSGATTIAGITNATTGYVDGAATTTAKFNGIKAIAVDGSGNVYVADSANQAVREVSTGGTVTTLLGPSGAGVTPNLTTPALSSSINGIAVDGSGNVFIADQNSSPGVSKIFEYIP